MLSGQLTEELEAEDRDFERLGVGGFLETMMVGPDGLERMVRVYRKNRIVTAEQRVAQKMRNAALLQLQHAAIAPYLGTLQKGLDHYDVFGIPKLRPQNRRSFREAPATLIDTFLDILPALEELHAAGLVHGTLGRSTIRQTEEGQTLLIGLQSSELQEDKSGDLQALANYGASSLGTVPEIPVEVFLQSGNRRINRRLCSAIQGSLGADGYEPVRSVKEFHNLLSGKSKTAPVRKPPIVTQGMAFGTAANDDFVEMASDSRQPREKSSDWTPGLAAIGVAMTAMFAIAYQQYEVEIGSLQAITVGLPEETVADETVPLIIAELNTANELDETQDAGETLAGEHEAAISTDGAAQLVLAELNATNEVDDETQGLSEALGSEAEQAVAAQPSPIPVTLNLDLFEAQTSTGGITAPTENPEIERVEVQPDAALSESTTVKQPLDLSLFKAQTAAWVLNEPDRPDQSVEEDAPEPADIANVEKVAAVEIASTGTNSTDLLLDAPDIAPVETAAGTQVFEDFTTLPEEAGPSAGADTPNQIETARSRVISSDEPGEIVEPHDTTSTLYAWRLEASREESAVVAERPKASPASIPPPQSTVQASTSYDVPGRVFQDCAGCPDMVVLPNLTGTGQSIAMSVSETTVAQYRLFLGQTQNGNFVNADGTARDRSPLNPGFYQSENHPVTYVSLSDAESFANWLSAKTGQRYRLPTGNEWEAASPSPQRFSPSSSGQCSFTNGADASLSVELPYRLVAPCDDGFQTTAPVKSFPANRYGLFDMIGNVAEWTSSPQGTDLNIRKGGSWISYGTELGSESVIIERGGAKLGEVGFRLVREMN